MASGRLRIGQGAILYHRNWKTHPILTLLDMGRTGDDLARFHFQHRLGLTIFGMHGSFILVQNDVERGADFDLGPKGSITEDAMWALMQMQNGVRTRWVEGYLEEQSTLSAKAFIEQRCRWFQGLVIVAFHAPVKLRWRLFLALNTFMWGMAPFAVLYTIGHFVFGFAVPAPIRATANVSYAYFVMLYIVGLKANLDEHGVTHRGKRIGWHIAMLAMLVVVPFAGIIEACGVLVGMLTKVRGFIVVEKLLLGDHKH